jgi:hypothetical protein
MTGSFFYRLNRLVDTPVNRLNGGVC